MQSAPQNAYGSFTYANSIHHWENFACCGMNSDLTNIRWDSVIIPFYLNMNDLKSTI